MVGRQLNWQNKCSESCLKTRDYFETLRFSVFQFSILCCDDAVIVFCLNIRGVVAPNMAGNSPKASLKIATLITPNAATKCLSGHKNELAC